MKTIKIILIILIILIANLSFLAHAENVNGIDVRVNEAFNDESDLKVKKTSNGVLITINTESGKKRIRIVQGVSSGHSFKRDKRQKTFEYINLLRNTEANNKTLTLNFKNTWKISSVYLGAGRENRLFITFWDEKNSAIAAIFMNIVPIFGTYDPKIAMEEGYFATINRSDKGWVCTIKTPNGTSKIKLVKSKQGELLAYDESRGMYPMQTHVVINNNTAKVIHVNNKKLFKLNSVYSSHEYLPDSVLFGFVDSSGDYFTIQVVSYEAPIVLSYKSY